MGQKSRDTEELWYLNLGSLLYCMPLANAGDKLQVSRFVLFFFISKKTYITEKPFAIIKEQNVCHFKYHDTVPLITNS